MINHLYDSESDLHLLSLHLHTSLLMPESLQQLVLDHLEAHGSLSDSRTLTIPGATSPAADAESQITILGALNSLLSREVSDLPSRNYPLPNRLYPPSR